MPGAVLQVFASAGQRVSSGEALIRLEAMKMENEVRAPGNGEVKEVRVKAGESVEAGQILLVVE